MRGYDFREFMPSHPPYQFEEYLLATADGQGHIDALSTTLIAFGRHARYASE
jgi:hypothetical protein